MPNSFMFVASCSQLLIKRVPRDLLDQHNVTKQMVHRGNYKHVKWGWKESGKNPFVVRHETQIVLTNKNNPVTEVRFRDTFPTSLGGLNYDQQAGDVAYLSCDITFSYKYYEFADSGASSTSVTTT